MKKEKLITKQDILFFLGTLLLVFTLRTFVFTPVEVHGDSMETTLSSGEYAFGLKFGDIDRFDIVTFEAPDQPKEYIKRVIGLPGDLIEYQDDVLYINNESYPEPYLADSKAQLTNNEQLTENMVYQVPDGAYFVLGDNRRNSKDSRQLGAIEETRIHTRSKVIFWPLNKIRVID